MSAVAERRFPIMGSTGHVVVRAATEQAAEALADLAVMRLDLLQACWTRFDPASELNRLNARAGRGPVEVSDDLHLLLERSLQAWELTDGAFDPTGLRAISDLGYQVSYALRAPQPPASSHVGFPTPAGIELGAGVASLPHGVGLDSGGIGKGLAADIVAADLAAAGADGVLVNIGGDIALAGPHREWEIDVEDEDEIAVGGLLGRLTVPGGSGVSTSSTRRRRWSGLHHLMDPATGQPLPGTLTQATVVAPTAWQAEALSTAALVVAGTAIARGKATAAALQAASAWAAQRGGANVLTAAGGLHVGTGLQLQPTPQETCHA